MFVWHQLNQAVYYVILFGSINLVLQVLRNIFYLFSTNEKNELQKEFELFLYKKLGLCDYERIESPHFLEQKEKAGYYIGGQWGEFGKQLDIVFELFGNIIVLSGMLLLLLKLKFVFVFGNLRVLYYSEHYMKSDWMHLFLITKYSSERSLLQTATIDFIKFTVLSNNSTI